MKRASEILFDDLASPALRASVVRAMTLIDNVVVANRNDRHGIAIGRHGDLTQVVFDPDTGKYPGARGVRTFVPLEKNLSRTPAGVRRLAAFDNVSFMTSTDTPRLPAWATAARFLFWTSWVPLLLPPWLDFYGAADAGSSLWVGIRISGASVGVLAGLAWAVAEYERRKPLRRSDFFPPIPRGEIRQRLYFSAVCLYIAVRGLVSELRGDHFDTIWLILFLGSAPLVALSTIRTLWYLRHYAAADKENRLHGR